jgi:hypothetical protein
MSRHLILVLTAALLLPPAAAAQEFAAPDTVPVPASPCDTPGHHQFDFWLGEWRVTSNGQPAGTNVVETTQNGCVLQENWRGSGIGGITGTSFNIYDRETGRWHQTWVDASGTLLLLDGGLSGESMVLEGERPAPGGEGSVQHRITWTPNPDRSVRQLWEASQDGGETWNVIFDGLYTRSELLR